jgi:hypothetical protein
MWLSNQGEQQKHHFSRVIKTGSLINNKRYRTKIKGSVPVASLRLSAYSPGLFSDGYKLT